jgi:hypothetical protein
MSESIMSVSVNNSYTLNALADKPKDFEPSKGFRLCRVIFKQGADKTATKEQSQYCSLPEVSETFVQSFMRTEAGKLAVVELIESLQDTAVRNVWIASKRSPCDADLTVEALGKVAEAQSESVRLTREAIVNAFKNEWASRIALSIAIERNEDAALIFTAESVNAEAAAAFWNSEAGAKVMAIAGNYLQFFVLASERKPAFPSEAIKVKVMQAIAYLDDGILKGKLEEKLQAAPIASVDDSGL